MQRDSPRTDTEPKPRRWGRGRYAALRDLLLTMVRHWRAAVATGTITGLLAVAGSFLTVWGESAHATPRHLAELGVVVWACVAVPLAFFAAWCEQRENLISAEESLVSERDQKLPKLFGYFRFIGKGAATGLDSPLFIAYIEIRNDGFRSSVKDFCPAVVLNGREYLGRLAKAEKKAVTLTSPVGDKDRFKEKDAIYNVTKVPIEQGDVRAGHLHFYFPQHLGNFDKHLVKIYFRDYRNNKFVTQPIIPKSTVDLQEVPHLAGMFSLEQHGGGDESDGQGG